VRDQNAWFKTAVRLAKIAEPTQQAMSIAMAKGTGLYPRDLLFKAMSSGIVDLAMPDGRLVTRGRYFRETVMFQGAILEQDTVQALPAGGYTTLTFPLPVLDTAGFWNMAAPRRLTIPAGIEVVEVTAGWHTNNINVNGNTVPALNLNGARLARSPRGVSGWPGGTISSGPRAVSVGDYFEFAVFVPTAQATNGTQECFMCLNVLQAT
jgi:hypothetical protein